MKKLVISSIVSALILTTSANAGQKVFQHPMKMENGEISWKLYGDGDHYNTFKEDREHPCHIGKLGIRHNILICNEKHGYFKFKKNDKYWDRDCSYAGHCSSDNAWHTGVDYDLPLHNHEQEFYDGKKHLENVKNPKMHGVKDDVHAVNDGVVVKVVRNGKTDHAHGNTVVIRHDNVIGYGTVYSSYSHLSKVSVKEDQEVSRGQKIGVIGGTAKGNASHWIHHLHFEIKKSPGRDGVGSPNNDCNGGKPAFGYTKKKPDGCGYYNPVDFIGKVFMTVEDDSGDTDESEKEILTLRRVGDVAWYPNNVTCMNAQRWFEVHRVIPVVDPKSEYAWSYQEKGIGVCSGALFDRYPGLVDYKSEIDKLLFGKNNDEMCQIESEL